MHLCPRCMERPTYWDYLYESEWCWPTHLWVRRGVIVLPYYWIIFIIPQNTWQKLAPEYHLQGEWGAYPCGWISINTLFLVRLLYKWCTLKILVYNRTDVCFLFDLNRENKVIPPSFLFSFPSQSCSQCIQWWTMERHTVVFHCLDDKAAFEC